MAVARFIIGLTAMIAAAPLIAQSAAESPKNVAADAREMPQTAALNAQVAGNNAAIEAQNGANQAQYDADRAAYAAAMREHHHDVLATDEVFIRQQLAYADAMRDYRAQVAMCKRGYKSACNLPTPDPRNYM